MKSIKTLSKKAVFAVLAFVVAACMCLGFATLKPVKAETSLNVTSLNLVGASIRVQEPMGMRFKAEISKEEYQTVMENDEAIFGILICPADFVTEGKTLDFDDSDGLTKYQEGEDASNTYQAIPATPQERGEVYAFTGAIVNINEANFARGFMARAYVGVKNEGDSDYTYAYGDSLTRTVYTVATYAVNDEESAPAQTYLENIIEKVSETYTTYDVTYTINGEALEDDQALAVGDEIKVTATVSNGENSVEAYAAIKNQDNLTYDAEKGAYIVSDFGDVDLTATVGEHEESKAGYKCSVRHVFNSEATKDNLVLGMHGNMTEENTAAKLTYMNEFMGKSDVLEY